MHQGELAARTPVYFIAEPHGDGGPPAFDKALNLRFYLSEVKPRRIAKAVNEEKGTRYRVWLADAMVIQRNIT